MQNFFRALRTWIRGDVAIELLKRTLFELGDQKLAIQEMRKHMDARLQAILDEATVANGERIAATKTLNDVVDFFHASVSQNMSDVDWAAVQTKLLEMKAATPALAAAMTSAAGVLVPAVPVVTPVAPGETVGSPLPPAVPAEASPPNPVQEPVVVDPAGRLGFPLAPETAGDTGGPAISNTPVTPPGNPVPTAIADLSGVATSDPAALQEAKAPASA